MKRIICFISFISLLIGCKSERGKVINLNKQTTYLEKDLPNSNKIERMILFDSIVFIKLDNGVSFNWNNNSYRIEEDSIFNKLKSTYSDYRDEIVQLISDTTITTAKVCDLDRNLLLGDLAYLIISKIDNISILDFIEITFDVFEYNCPYPIGYFYSIEEYRIELKNKIELYASKE